VQQARADDLPPNWLPVYDEARAVTYDPFTPSQARRLCIVPFRHGAAAV
jgi:hypothetical protein